MRILLIHADHFEYTSKEKAIKKPEELTSENKQALMNEVLVAFCTVEKEDEKNSNEICKKAVESIKEVARLVKTDDIVIYPYAHLSSDLGSPDVAIPLLANVEKTLKSDGLEVKRSPFGYYKSFKLHCKGHPLSELSRNIEVKKIKSKSKPFKTVYKVLTLDGILFEPEDYVKVANEEEVKTLVLKEALKEELPGGKPRFIDFCKKFGIEWESYSDLGHMRYGPESTLMFDLIGEYAWKVANSIGISVFQIRGTNMFDLAVRPVKEHAALFGDRLYELEVENKRLVLRYAACHQQFSSVKDWTLSYKQLPFGTFENADSYRLEQSGELLLCFRVRKLHMPDFHIYCKDVENAKEVSLEVHKKIYEEIRKLNRDYVSIYNTTNSFFNENRSFFNELLKTEKKSILINFIPEGIYYWVLNVEYTIIDALNRPREIATFQIDVGNAKRFGISYTSEDGNKYNPVIIHTALIGTVERYLYTLLDSAVKQEEKGKKPMLPIWISPSQVRILPLSGESDKFLKMAKELMQKIEKENVRVDIDDREETLEKRIRDAETSWIPYIIVIGPKELKKQKFPVRLRELNLTKQMTMNELIKELNSKTKGYPLKELPMPKFLNQRPGYN